MESEITLKFLESFLPVWDKIKSFTVKEIHEPGICLSTVTSFVKVEFENGKKPTHLLVKTFPECPAKQQWLRKLNIFPKEIFFYDTILPELKRLQNNCDDADKSSLRITTPPFLAGGISNVNSNALETFMALTNLRMTRGFKRPSLYTGLDYNHCQLVIKEIAKLHALNWVYRKTKAVISLQVLHPIMAETFFSEDNKYDLQDLLSGNFDIFQSLVENSLGKDSVEFERIRMFRRDFADILIKYVNHKGLNEKEAENEYLAIALKGFDGDFIEEPWAVGSHGDLRQSNLLFRYKPNSSEPIEVALFDFQSFRESCPTIDLAYFIYTSTDADTRENHLNDLLQLYHDTFIHLCTLLKKDPYPGFSTNALKRRFHRAKVFGLLSAVLVLPCVFLTNPQENGTAADANGNFTDFLTFAKRAEEDLNVMQSRFSDLAKELCKQGVV